MPPKASAKRTRKEAEDEHAAAPEAENGDEDDVDVEEERVGEEVESDDDGEGGSGDEGVPSEEEMLDDELGGEDEVPEDIPDEDPDSIDDADRQQAPKRKLASHGGRAKRQKQVHDRPEPSTRTKARSAIPTPPPAVLYLISYHLYLGATRVTSQTKLVERPASWDHFQTWLGEEKDKLSERRTFGPGTVRASARYEDLDESDEIARPIGSVQEWREFERLLDGWLEQRKMGVRINLVVTLAETEAEPPAAGAGAANAPRAPTTASLAAQILEIAAVIWAFNQAMGSGTGTGTGGGAGGRGGAAAPNRGEDVAVGANNHPPPPAGPGPGPGPPPYWQHPQHPYYGPQYYPYPPPPAPDPALPPSPPQQLHSFFTWLRAQPGFSGDPRVPFRDIEASLNDEGWDLEGVRTELGQKDWEAFGFGVGLFHRVRREARRAWKIGVRFW